ncbi:hypothetical protein [Nonomuraea roseoviolacea]|uniref:hypothetical protein n=1 Tax=Nonomuraea roseoviolacea TaxID=103837 RepID=UPI0031D1E994
MNVGDFTMTKHALERAVEMAVTAEEVKAALYKPELRYDQADRPGQHVRMAGRIALAMQGTKIVTVLHRTGYDYKRGDVAHDVRMARGVA